MLVCTPIRLYLEGLLEVLGKRGLTVSGAIDGIADCIAKAQGLDPDVVLVDIANAGGEAIIRRLVTQLPRTPVVVLGVPDDDGAVIACAEAGAAAYVTRDQTLDDLQRTLEAVARGESACSPKRAAMLLRRLAALAELAELAAHAWGGDVRLTPREHEVLRLIDGGLSNKQIARQLCVELSTVKNHVHNILEKLHVDRRAQAAAWLRRRESVALGVRPELVVQAADGWLSADG